MTGQGLSVGQTVTGAYFSEPMRVVTIQFNNDGSCVVGLVGTRTNQFRQVNLSDQDLRELRALDAQPTFDGDGKLLRLGVQAYALGIAYEFDPYFALSVSRVDPLPHQLEAVYDYLLKLPRVRFLLADDAGAGKTIMAGLLIRELKLRGLAERTLIVCPANLTFQWQRELREKFEERFFVFRGAEIRDQFGINQWIEQKQIITSLDLAKRADIFPGIRQVQWDLVIVDEAHRMSASDAEHKSLRYRLGELLRDTSDHILLLTATPHKGDPENFTLFLQLLDKDVYADVLSIREAMEQRQAPFYLRRTKEAMVYFPERQPNGEWKAQRIFTRRIPHTVDFQIDGPEFDLYREITQFVRTQSIRAASRGDDPRARAIGFLMALYQRRLASSTFSMRRSLENRARRLEEGLKRARELARLAPPEVPSAEDLDEMEESERQRIEEILEAVTLTENVEDVRTEIAELNELAVRAKTVEDSGAEAKLSRLKSLLHEQGFFDHPEKRLLIFTEFRDTLDYLVGLLREWKFRVGSIHGSMKTGSRDEPGTRLYAEQQFKDADIQILVATEAAGEGINLQFCNILFNYDIPWNPNRLEQRMGRIHRYGQKKDCLIFNFVATNTIEGRVLQRLLEKLQEIRDALDDDAVFNVVGEILPASQVERILRDYYAGRIAKEDLESRLLEPVDEGRFRAICQNALEGLATKRLNLDMLIERRARAQERRVVPETIARFLLESSQYAGLGLKPFTPLPHSFDAGRTPSALQRQGTSAGWKLQPVALKYPRLSTDRDVAELNALEWVTPGHPLFEALRRYVVDLASPMLARGARFYSLQHEAPVRLDFFRARIVDGLGNVIHERLFVVETDASGTCRLQDPAILGNFTPAPVGKELPPASDDCDVASWLNANVLAQFLSEVKRDRLAELDGIANHIDISLTALIQRADEEIGSAAMARDRGDQGAEGRLAQAETRQDELRGRRDRRREELSRQRALTLQSVERLASVLVLPHPEREAPEVRRLQPNPETEAVAMRVVMEHEQSQGRQIYDVSEKNLGYDVTSLDLSSGDLRLIEVKGLGASAGTVLLTPNERRVAEDRRDCFWLYVVTNCDTTPVLQEPIKDPARLDWNEVKKIAHYYLSVDAMKKPMDVREGNDVYGV